MLNKFISYLNGSGSNSTSLMTKSFDIERNIDIKENQVQVTKKRCSISQKLISNSNSSSKSNTECITELKKIRINNIKNVIIATLNASYLVSKLRLLDKEFLIF